MPVVDFSKQKKDIQHSKLMAQVLSGAFDGYDPNAQITGRAIPLHPVTALAKALQTGFGAYQGARAQAKEDDLDAQQRAAMMELVKSGKPITAQDLFNSGNLEPEKLAEALVKTNTVKPEYINTADGVYEVSPGAEPKQIMANGKPLKRSIDNPELQGLITAMKQGSMAREGVGADMRPFVAQNRDYSPGAFPRLDQSTTLMPVPGSPPQQQQGLTRLDPNSEEAKAVMRQMQESGADTIQIEPQQAQQSVSPAAIDQIEAAKEAAKNAVNLPYDIQKQQQVGDIKAQQDAALAETKAAIENQQKVDQVRNQAKIDLPKVQANATYTKGLVDEILSHPGLSDVVGVPNPLTAWTPGTKAAGFKAKMEQLGGKNFLEAFESLKGGGQITEIEGKKATAAIAALNTAQSEEEFKRELTKLKDVIDAGAARAMGKAGMGTEAQPTQSYDPEAMRKKYGVK